MASLPKPGPVDAGYAGAGLDAGPYALTRAPRLLLIGGGGGFRPAAALRLGASHADVAEPEPVLASALRQGARPVAPACRRSPHHAAPHWTDRRRARRPRPL